MYRLDCHPTVSKHWRKWRALTPINQYKSAYTKPWSPFWHYLFLIQLLSRWLTFAALQYRELLKSLTNAQIANSRNHRLFLRVDELSCVCVFAAAESEAGVVDYGQCHYSHVADNSLPTYNEVVLQRTLGLSHTCSIYTVMARCVSYCVQWLWCSTVQHGLQ